MPIFPLPRRPPGADRRAYAARAGHRIVSEGRKDMNTQQLGAALGTDFFSVREQFTDEQWDKFVATRRFVDAEVVPVAARNWERAEIAWDLVRRLPELGVVGEEIEGFGCPGLSPMACGLVTMELHRGDGS